uniref:Bac_surface_Ag domain-containing protein n=1 Tax=Caenorhabditis tropicalis TaxID=1561998 RepID=A0A1I7TWP2_9PELO
MPEKTFHKAQTIREKAPGVPSIVEAVQFHGVRITKNDALVKEVSELYRSKNLDELVHNSHLAARHLQEMGLLENAVALIDTSPDSKQGYVVNFLVREPKSFTAGVKAGVSTNGDADVSLNAGKQSVGGRGEAINTQYTYTVKGDHCFNISAIKPFLGWQKYSNVSATLYRSLAHMPWNQSDVDENAAIFTYNGQQWNQKLLHQMKLNAIWRTLRASRDAAFSVREQAGHTLKFSVENSVAVDTRDRPILASRGILARWATEYAGVFGDASFLKNTLDLQAAAPLPLGFILAASVQAKHLRGLGEREVHILDRCYLGGQQDVRGFGLNTIGVKADNSCLGGGASLAGVVHLYRPLIPPNMLFAHAFLASGSFASVHARNPIQQLQDSQRVSAGLGLAFVFKSIFRLELNYTFPLKYVIGDCLLPGFHIGAGVNFL